MLFLRNFDSCYFMKGNVWSGLGVFNKINIIFFYEGVLNLNICGVDIYRGIDVIRGIGLGVERR